MPNSKYSNLSKRPSEIHERQRSEVRAMCARLGVTIIRAGPIFKLVRPGYELAVSDLRFVKLPDLLAFSVARCRPHSLIKEA